MFKFKSRKFIFMLTAAIITFSLIPHFVYAGFAGNGVHRLSNPADTLIVGYWDLRERKSYFQVTNTSASDIRIHIQVFNVDDNCMEFNYFDTMTGRDTHIYDVSSLDRNNGDPLGAPDLDGGHGIIGVTVVNPDNNSLEFNPVLTGNLRIIDTNGYEYRTNLEGVDLVLNGLINGDGIDNDHSSHFNGVDGSVFTDLIVVGVDIVESPGGILPVTEQIDIVLWDNNENPISCNPVVLGCFPGTDNDFSPPREGGGLINVGINQAVVNSRGNPSLCNGTDPEGFIEFIMNTPFMFQPEPMMARLGPLSEGNFPNSDAYVIFTGLNNNSGTGSMDSVGFNLPLLSVMEQ